MVITAATVLIASTFTTSAAQAAIPNPPKKSAQKQAITPEKKSASAVPLKDRDTVLGKGWKTSADRAVTAVADSDGLHLLVADSTTGYDWKTVTVLSEPQLPADTWIGNSCVMDDHHAAVAYAPRTFTNKPDLMMGGAFTAIVNLDDGSVTKLPFTASLAYFDPTCNPATHTAVFTALHDAKTRLVTVNAKGTTVADTTANGEITSAVPTKDGVVAAAGNRLVHVDRKGKTAELAATKHAPYGIRVTGDGRVSYIDRTGNTDANVRTYAHGKKTTVASGQIAAMNLRQGTDGTVYLTGKASHGKGFTSSGIKTLGVSPDAEVSTHGRLAVDPVVSPAVLAGVDRINNAGRGFTKTASKEPAAETTPGHISHVLTITGAVPGTGKHTKQKAAEPGSTAGGTPSPALTGSSKPQMSTMSVLTTADDDPRANDPIDTDRWCSVPRNDVATQALQPTPNQVEWAVDMAVQGNLRSGYLTQGGWRSQTGISTIDPQGLFPKPALTGGGRIPAQVQLGILAQESNLWQAESGAIPGQMGSPLAAVDGFYGHETGGSLSDFWAIHWNLSDCGYGVGQVTDGMRKAGYEKEHETSLPASTQRAVAIDYTTNIAASLYILADKWNEVHESGQTIAVNNDDPAKPENWFTAVWNYNLGFNKKADEATNGNWGLGWYNNPANPVYPASRLAFMNTDLDPLAAKDAAHPQNWPYEEKVMGWASWSIDTGHSYATSGRQDWPGESGFSSAGFRPAYWNGTNGTVIDQASAKYHRAHATPPLDAFCNTKNNCNTANPPDCPDADCYKQYWWHESNTTWKSDCATSCGFENIKYVTAVSEPGRGTRLQYGTPVCSGAPSGAKVVDSVPAGTNTWSSCGTTTTDGSFQFTFYPDPNATGPGLGQYDAKADLHQIGGGYQGHYWYTHARDADHLGGDAGRMTILGDWKLNSAISGSQAKVYVHIPDTGAQVSNASYKIITPFGAVTKTIDQGANESNQWVSLGAYNFKDQAPEVQLSNSTPDGAADKDLAYDAVAFVPGDYSGMPGIAFGDPDVNAAQPGDITTPQDMTPDGIAQGEEPIESIQQEFSDPRNTYVPWCAAKPFGFGTSRKIWTNRTEGCIKGQFGFIKSVNGVVTGTATFDFQAEMKLYSDEVGWNTAFKFKLVDASGEAMSEPLYVTVDDTCSLDCTKNGPRSDSGNLWWEYGQGDEHTYSMSQIWDWGDSRPSDLLFPKWAMKGELGGVWTDNDTDVTTDGAKAEIRCDSVVPQSYPGCVFDQYKPTYVMNSKKFPAAAAHAWLVQNKLPGHFGSKAHGAPLTYLGSNVMSRSDPTKKQSTENREVICPGSWDRNQDATLSPELNEGNQADTQSCDEMAPAASYNSAGMSQLAGGYNPVEKSGDECVQTYAKKGSDGVWHLLPDLRYPLPTWNEECGRATISNNQNVQSMRPIAQFIVRNRLMDKDEYWLDLDGFTP
ncbi:Tat pathway signal protein [Streptomyces sp. NBC_01764]|uniref:golvesin C-terminal-like domain-containing protein n=1 Tax=Streptomyces sp. NBC_01764 TaxID=2975935 RepID=UPI0022579855|nr:Tat pathway signal protein [Streptomyces sp. NBC_01764]